ncbi:hypothetical protein GCM10029992_29990 [Glycomyces albus]
MRAYADGRIEVLVATTVIEVGVNVPNATAMVILDAERFGISQLHQLRGRVGRGSHPGLCLLVSEAADGTSSRERLEAVASTTDGFELAELDLEQRREGDVLGAAQSGTKSHVRLLSAEGRRHHRGRPRRRDDTGRHRPVHVVPSALRGPRRRPGRRPRRVSGEGLSGDPGLD